MPLSERRVLRTFRYAMYFDGIDDYVRVEPFSVYGWSEYTLMAWTYPWSIPRSIKKTAMIGWGASVPVYWYGTWLEVLPTAAGAYFRNFFRLWRPSDNSYYQSVYDIKMMLASFVNSAFIVSKNLGRYRLYINASLARDIDISTYLEQGYVTPMDRTDMTRFVLGADPLYIVEYASVYHASVLIYSRALSDSEIAWNYLYPDNPVRSGLVLWLKADPQYINDIDNDDVLEWIDLSGSDNHGKIYGATLVQLIRDPVR